MKQKILAYTRSRMDAVLRSVLKNGGWAASAQITLIVSGVLETFLLARFLPIETFGVVLVLAAAVDLLFGILDFRSGEAVIKFVPETLRQRGSGAVSSLLRFILVVDLSVGGLGLVLIVLFQSLIFRWVSVSAGLATVLLVLGVGAACKASVRSFGSYLRVTGRFPLSMKIGMATPITRLILLLVFVLSNPTALSVALGISLSEMLFALVMGGVTFTGFRRDGISVMKSSHRFDARDRREFTRFMVSNNLAGTLRVLSTKLDVMLIGALVSTAAVAIYKVAGRLAGFLLMLSDPLVVAVYPEMSHLYAEQRSAELKKMVGFLTRSFAVLAVLAVGISALAGKWFLGTILGDAYLSSYPVMLIMMLGTASAMVFFWARPLLLVRGMAPALLGVAAVSLTVQIVSLYLLTPPYGVIGAGIAFALNYVVTVGLYLILLTGSRRRQRNGFGAVSVTGPRAAEDERTV